MDQSWAVFVGGLGLGSAITAFVQHSLARRAKLQDLQITELKEAFTGFLAAFAKMAEDDVSLQNKATFSLWVARVQLVASSDVNLSVEALKNTPPNSSSRRAATDLMLLAMRRDLGLSRT